MRKGHPMTETRANFASSTAALNVGAWEIFYQDLNHGLFCGRINIMEWYHRLAAVAVFWPHFAQVAEIMDVCTRLMECYVEAALLRMCSRSRITSGTFSSSSPLSIPPIHCIPQSFFSPGNDITDYS